MTIFHTKIDETTEMRPGDWVPVHLVDVGSIDRAMRKVGMDPDSELFYRIAPSCGHRYFDSPDFPGARGEDAPPTVWCKNCGERLPGWMWVQLPEMPQRKVK